MISIREAKPVDAAGIARVHVESWRNAYASLIPQEFLDGLTIADRERSWKAWLSSSTGGTHIWVAASEEEGVAGFASGGVERDQDSFFKGEIYALYLLPAYQRRGIGTRLVQTVARQLRWEHLDSMIIWVLEENPARKFYAALGGKHLEDHRKAVTIGGAVLYETAYGWTDLSVFA
ncbi:MAG TPA: GNAT family N-acetyltransferase [Anaerolineaceae bacterium]|nr:GNAT family N-acetyltransferase [Anaerolineaceae bacterium]